MTYTISFDPNHNSEQRKMEIEMILRSLGQVDVKELTLKIDGYPDRSYVGDDVELVFADEIEIKYEKV